MWRRSGGRHGNCGTGIVRHSLTILAFVVWPVIALGQPPVTDPTVLTTQAQERAIAALRELFDAKLAALKDEVTVQKKTLESSDARLVLRLDGVPAVIDAQLAHTQRLMEERFNSIDKQFHERDERGVQLATSAKQAIDTQNFNNAALFTELKSTFAKQIEALQSNQASELKGLASTVSIIKDAQTASDNRSVGIGSSWGVLVGAVGIIVGVGSLFVMMFRRPEKDAPPAQVVYVPTPATLPTTPMGHT
jgi:hypothetical protein